MASFDEMQKEVRAAKHKAKEDYMLTWDVWFDASNRPLSITDMTDEHLTNAIRFLNNADRFPRIRGRMQAILNGRKPKLVFLTHKTEFEVRRELDSAPSGTTLVIGGSIIGSKQFAAGWVVKGCGVAVDALASLVSGRPDSPCLVKP